MPDTEFASVSTSGQLAAATVKPISPNDDEQKGADASALVDKEAKQERDDDTVHDEGRSVVQAEKSEDGRPAVADEPAKISWADEVEEEELKLAEGNVTLTTPDDASSSTVTNTPIQRPEQDMLWRRTSKTYGGSGPLLPPTGPSIYGGYIPARQQAAPFPVGFRDMSSPWRRGTAPSMQLSESRALPDVPAADNISRSHDRTTAPSKDVKDQRTDVWDDTASSSTGHLPNEQVPDTDYSNPPSAESVGSQALGEEAAAKDPPEDDEGGWNVVQKNHYQRRRASLEELTTALWPLIGGLNRYKESFTPSSVRGPPTREGSAPLSSRYGVMLELLSRCNNFAHLMSEDKVNAAIADTAGDGLTRKEIQEHLSKTAHILYPKLREAFTGESLTSAADQNAMWRKPMTSMLKLMDGRTAMLTEKNVSQLAPLVARLRQDLRAAIRKNDDYGRSGRLDYTSAVPSFSPRTMGGTPSRSNAAIGSTTAARGTDARMQHPGVSSIAVATGQRPAPIQPTGGPVTARATQNTGTVTFDLRGTSTKLPLDTHIARNRQGIIRTLVTLCKDLHGHSSSFTPSRYIPRARELGSTAHFGPMFERPNVMEQLLNSVKRFTQSASGGRDVRHDGLGDGATDEQLTEKLSEDSAKLYIELYGHLRGMVTNIPDNVHMLWRSSYSGQFFVAKNMDQQIMPNHIRQLLPLATSLEHNLKTGLSRYEKTDDAGVSWDRGR